MQQSSRYSSPGEESNPHPFGRGCLPFTIVILISMAIGGGIGWAVYDWIGAGAGVFLALAVWAHFIWFD